VSGARTFSSGGKWVIAASLIVLVAVFLINRPHRKHHGIVLYFPFENDSLLVTAHAHEWEELPPDNRPGLTFVHGTLVIRNMTHQRKQYNISRFLLKLSDSTKQLSEISYDDFGDRLVTDEYLPPGTSINLAVYWGFKGTLDSVQVAALTAVCPDTAVNH
jgi:hypothetical protein